MMTDLVSLATTAVGFSARGLSFGTNVLGFGPCALRPMTVVMRRDCVRAPTRDVRACLHPVVG